MSNKKNDEIQIIIFLAAKILTESTPMQKGIKIIGKKV